MKSWSIARQLIINAIKRPIRWLCCRETMLSIEDSVHQLLTDQIALLEATAHFKILKNRIEGINGSLFSYAGLRTDAGHLKSYESYDGAWVEEAAQVSKHSWEILLPTIRKEGSEIWVSFNPELITDDTYKRWVLNPPPGCVTVKTSWKDADEVGWLSAKSRAEIEHTRVTDPDTYMHIYEGLCVKSVTGAIYSTQLQKVEAEGRIRPVPYDASRPVYTAWDLGIGDQCAIWFLQASPFEYHFIDYYENNGLPLPHYNGILQGQQDDTGKSRRYVYAKHYLPHDAKARNFLTGKTVQEQMLAVWGGDKISVVPNIGLTEGINAARTFMDRCYFDGERCYEGLQRLRRYRWSPDGKLGLKKKTPLHDDNSNGADAFRMAAVGVKALSSYVAPPVQPYNIPFDDPFFANYKGEWS